jgi:hypothetical protein
MRLPLLSRAVIVDLIAVRYKVTKFIRCCVSVISCLVTKILCNQPLLYFVTHQRYAEERRDYHDSLWSPDKQRRQAAVGQRFPERGHDGQFCSVAPLNFGLDNVERSGQIRCSATADEAGQHGVLKRDESVGPPEVLLQGSTWQGQRISHAAPAHKLVSGRLPHAPESLRAWKKTAC